MQEIIKSFVSWLSEPNGKSNFYRQSLFYSDLNYSRAICTQIGRTKCANPIVSCHILVYLKKNNVSISIKINFTGWCSGGARGRGRNWGRQGWSNQMMIYRFSFFLIHTIKIFFMSNSWVWKKIWSHECVFTFLIYNQTNIQGHEYWIYIL